MKIERRLKEIAGNEHARTSGRLRTGRGTLPRVLDSKSWNNPDHPTGIAAVRGKNVIMVAMGNNPDGQGEACAGIELLGAETVVVTGAAHPNMLTIDNYSKTGFVIDYHLGSGNYRRVFLGCGTRPARVYSTNPHWGSGKVPDVTADLGQHKKYTIDLTKWAPPEWDGTCWFSVYMQNTGTGRGLTATLAWRGPSE